MATMCTARKPRSSYTLEEDVVALRAITAPSSTIFTGGSAGAKLQQWVAIAERVSAQGFEVTGDALRRHVADIVKKHKRQGPEPPGERMRWGMPWPKSDTEVEREQLIEAYMARLEESKKAVVCVPRPPPKTAPSKKPRPPAPRQTAVQPVRIVSKTQPPVSEAPRSTFPVAVRTVEEVVGETAPASKRKEPEQITIEDDGYDFGDDWLPSTSPSSPTNSSEALKLKRQRLEMEERTHNRMLDIQSEQIKLQREQLRLQAEAMRTMAESTKAIAHALQALQKRLV